MVKAVLKKHLTKILIIAGIFTVAYSPVLASDISNAIYRGSILITNNSTAQNNLCVTFNMSTKGMQDLGYLNSTCNNSAIQSAIGADVAYMPATSGNVVWCIFVPDIGANESLYNFLYAGGGDMSSLIRYFPDSGGIATSDNVSMEFGNTFDIEVKGFVDVTSGANKDIVYKQDAFRLYINAANNIRAAILSGGDAEDLAITANTTSADQIIRVLADGIDFTIYINGVSQNTTSLGANSVPDNANDYTWVRNNSMPYVEYIKLVNR